jgi:hypothetical protein
MKKIPRISRAKFENIAYLTLNAVNMITYLMVFAASITKAKEGGLAEIIQAIYCTQVKKIKKNKKKTVCISFYFIIN